jgi:hypothetical protein
MTYMLSRIWSSQKLPKERMTSRDATGLPNERRLGCLKVYKMTIYETQKKKVLATSQARTNHPLVVFSTNLEVFVHKTLPFGPGGVHT